DRAIEQFRIAPLCEIQELVTVEDTQRMIDENTQQPVFCAAQCDFRAVLVKKVSADRIEPPVPESEQLSRFADLQIRGQHACAAQNGLDPCKKFTSGEWF